MKIRMIAVALLLFLTACSHTAVDPTANGDTGSPALIPSPAPPESTPAASPSPLQTPVPGLVNPVPFLSEIRLYSHTDIFTVDDMNLGGIAISSTPEDVTGILGQPDETVDLPHYASGPGLRYVYPDAQATFLEKDDAYILQDLTLTGGDLRTPRDIGIGSYIKEALLVYVDQIEFFTDNLAIFYRCNMGSSSLVAVPPSASMWAAGPSTEWIFQLSIPTETNPYAGYSQEQIEENYQDIQYYSLRFTTRYGRVTRINMTMGPYTQ